MITSVRVDDRLIHGQVALVWTKEFNTTHLVVVNDQAAKDKMSQMTLQMATPTGIKLLIKSVTDSIRIFNDERAKETPMFVLTNCIADALTIVNQCEVGSVNVANVGRFSNSNEQKITLTPQVFVDSKELSALKALSKLDIPVYNQVVPSSHKISVDTLLKGK